MTARQETVARVACGVLLAALLTGAGAWMTLMTHAVTKDEVLELIETRGPVNVKLLEYRLSEQDTKLQEVKESIASVDRNLDEVMVVLKSLTKDLDAHRANDP